MVALFFLLLSLVIFGVIYFGGISLFFLILFDLIGLALVYLITLPIFKNVNLFQRMWISIGGYLILSLIFHIVFYLFIPTYDPFSRADEWYLIFSWPILLVLKLGQLITGWS